MKFRFLIIVLLFPIIGFANMAQPWVDGALHSTFYANNKCIVQNEQIFITLDPTRPYLAKYKITYNIYSESGQSIPLVFLGIRLSDTAKIYVNHKLTPDIPLVNIADFPFLTDENDDYIKLKYAEDNEINVRKEDLIHFKADLKKGENKIYIEYEGIMEHNNFGFVRTYKLEYSLYPSKFWEYFGEIDVELDLGAKFEIISSNYKNFNVNNQLVHWKITSIDKDIFKIEVRKKTTLLAKILLAIDPAGLAFMAFFIFAYLHVKALKIKYTNKYKGYKYALSLGNFFVPIMFYVAYFYSFDLINWSLNQTYSDHGYYFLIVITLPLFWLIYGGIMWVIDKYYLKKIS